VKYHVAGLIDSGELGRTFIIDDTFTNKYITRSGQV